MNPEIILYVVHALHDLDPVPVVLLAVWGSLGASLVALCVGLADVLEGGT